MEFFANNMSKTQGFRQKIVKFYKKFQNSSKFSQKLNKISSKTQYPGGPDHFPSLEKRTKKACYKDFLATAEVLAERNLGAENFSAKEFP